MLLWCYTSDMVRTIIRWSKSVLPHALALCWPHDVMVCADGDL
jgi:hypothetical protein